MPAGPLITHHSCAQRAATMLRVVYFFPAYWVIAQALHWREYSVRQSAELLWPLFWLDPMKLEVTGPWIYGLSVAGLLVGCTIPQYRWARALAALSLTEYLALRFSLGKIHHSMHGWLLTSWLLCGLPEKWTNPAQLTRVGRQQLIRVCHACQLLVATTYTLSGVGKLLGAAYQAWLGQATIFHPSALSRHVAARLLETNEMSLLGDWTIKHGHYLWPATLGLLAIQLGAVWMARRPAFHFTLGMALVTFHAMTALTMNIDFTPAIVLCGALFVVSPFSETRLPRPVARGIPEVAAGSYVDPAASMAPAVFANRSGDSNQRS